MYEGNSGINAMNAKAAYNTMSQSGAATAAIQSLSEGILSRLNGVRMTLSEHCQSASHAADKIVGSAPTPISPNGKNVDHPAANCFLNSMQQMLDDIEHIGSELQDHLNRLHRAF